MVTENSCNLISKPVAPCYSADIGSDQSLAMAKPLLHTKPPKYTNRKPHAFDVSKLTYNTNITNNFETATGGFESLMELNNIEIN